MTAREFTFFNADSVSRSFEHEDKHLYHMARGTAGIIVSPRCAHAEDSAAYKAAERLLRLG